MIVDMATTDVLRGRAQAVDEEIEEIKSAPIRDPRGLASEEGRRWALRECMTIHGVR